MSVSRDRIVRPVDHAALFANRRSHAGGRENFSIFHDETNTFESSSPVQRLPSSMVSGRGNYSSWRPNGRGHTPFRVAQGKENTPMVSARRESHSVLPSWYPRTPLRDITHIVRAIERKRRAGMGAGDDGLETPTHQQVGVPVSGDQNCSMVTPGPAVGIKRSFPPSAAKVHKMLLNISKEIAEEEEAGFITPEKKLLNSIDKVEKIVMEEIQKMKSTPLAKREEREKRVKTLMSMR